MTIVPGDLAVNKIKLMITKSISIENGYYQRNFVKNDLLDVVKNTPLIVLTVVSEKSGIKTINFPNETKQLYYILMPFCVGWFYCNQYMIGKQ